MTHHRAESPICTNCKLGDLAEADTRLEQAEQALAESRRLLTLRPTPAQRERLFRLLSSVSATCEYLKLSIKR